MQTTELATMERPDALAFVQNPEPLALQSVLAEGNIAALSAPQRLQFLAAVCKSVGLNPLTRPFEFMNLQGKIVIYARRDATDQLRQKYNVSVQIVSRETIDGVHIVKARASMPNGREDEAIGAISIKSKSGDDLANALMKAETKAKRRVTLSICGLGFLDESELEGARQHPQRQAIGSEPVDPFKAEALPEPPQTWQEFIPTWGEQMTPDGDERLDSLVEGVLLQLWDENPDYPPLCAWGLRFVTRGLSDLGLDWETLRKKAKSDLPENPEDMRPDQLRRCAGWVEKKLEAQHVTQ